jgi:hypothetical protein
MVRRLGKVVWETGCVATGLPESARPTAPEDYMEPLKMSVCGRPVAKGVDDAIREEASFGLYRPSLKT